MATHLLVGNPTAQSGKNQERIDRALGAFERAGVACDFLATLPAGGTIARVTEALDAGRHRVIVSMGGDGTFREVAAGLCASSRRDDVALGMLPTGTANDQGRSFGLSSAPEDLESNVDVILRGNETRLDAGTITMLGPDGEVVARERFFDSAGWGISARILATRNQDRELVKKLGPLGSIYRDQLVYAGAALRVFLESYVVDDKFDVVVEADGTEHRLTGLTDLVVKATRIYGGAWIFDRESKHDDGFFEVVPFRGKRDWTSKAIVDHEDNPITEAMLNEIGVSHSKPFRVRRARFSFTSPAGGAPLAAQIDGEELVATGRSEVDVEQRAVRLIVPVSGWPPG